MVRGGIFLGLKPRGPGNFLGGLKPHGLGGEISFLLGIYWWSSMEREEMDKGRYYQKSLRNRNINYRWGRFFVTIQAEHNSCIFGAIVGDRCVLNELGEGVREVLVGMGQKYAEFDVGEYVIMPNHIHVIMHIKQCETNKEHHLGFLVGLFKGKTTFVYGKLKRAGLVPDIGEHLWMLDYWEKKIFSDEQLRCFERYIRNNANNWTKERWGAVTRYMLGEVDLLNRPLRAFVASQEGKMYSFKPCRLELPEHGALAPQTEETVLISTFTSEQEREVLRRALKKKRCIIHVCPQGIPRREELSDEQRQALDEKRLLFISPQEGGGRLNKKVATWCNEYVLRNAMDIWVGDITPNGMLAVLIETVRKVQLWD